MTSIAVIGEDELCCALGEQLVKQCLPGWATPSFCPINTRGITKLVAALPRYFSMVHQYPVLCVADTDGICPIEWLGQSVPKGTPEKFVLRLAVKEADAWALADRSGFAHAFGVTVASVPRDPEALPDAKREVLRLASRSTKRVIREEVPSAYDGSKPGNGYNLHLCSFVRSAWNAMVAAQSAPSLARAIRALEPLRER